MARLVARLDRRGRLALLSRDEEAAAPYASSIPDSEVKASWQLVEPTGVRLMHGPEGVRLLEYLPATRRLAWILRTLRLTPFVTAVNRVHGADQEAARPILPEPAGPVQLAVGRTL